MCRRLRFLATERPSSFETGQTLAVNGGLVML
jgi:hypothetical protein